MRIGLSCSWHRLSMGPSVSCCTYTVHYIRSDRNKKLLCVCPLYWNSLELIVHEKSPNIFYKHKTYMISNAGINLLHVLSFRPAEQIVLEYNNLQLYPLHELSERCSSSSVSTFISHHSIQLSAPDILLQTSTLPSIAPTLSTCNLHLMSAWSLHLLAAISVFIRVPVI